MASKPRGIRNNNPGNIEYGGFTKNRGATGSDGRFAKFPSPEDGIRSIYDLQRIYENKHGLTTVNERINRWAPTFENNTSAYARAVAKAMGITPDTPFRIDDPVLGPKFVGAVIQHENGRQPYSMDVIAAAQTSSAPSSVAMNPPLPNLRPDQDAQLPPEWARDVDNSNPIRVAYAPEADAPRPNPQMTPRRLDANPAPPLPPAPVPPVDVASLPPLAMPMPPSQAAMAPPTYQVASLAPDMPASMAPWNRTTATEVMPTVPKPASWDTSFPPQTNRQAQQDIISQMSPDWQQRAAQLGLGTAPPRTTPNVQIASVDPMVNQAADIYRQTMGAPMPGYLDAARESATYRPANIPAYTPASLVPPTPANRTPDTPATPATPSHQPARMVPDTPARTVSDTPARQTAWDAPIPPSPFDQVASIAQPSVAAPARVSAPPALPVPDAQTAWETWNTGGARIVPADGAFNLPSMPAPLSPPTPPAPTTKTVTEQVLNPEWQEWMDLQTAYPEADGIFGALPLGPDTYLRTSRAEPNKYIVKNNQVVERQPVPPMPNTQLPFPNGVPPTRSPAQQFADKIFSGLAAIGGGNMGAMGGLFGNMAMRSMLPVQSQTVGQNYGGYIPSKIYNTPTFNILSGGSKYPYSVGTNAATGQSSGQYTVQKDDGSSVTYGTDSWPDSFSAPPNSTMYEVSWS